MKPDWDKLMAKYEGRDDVVIGDADCTASGQSLCQDKGVSGYPTIKYYDAEGEHDYQGGRDYSSLEKHVEDNLLQKCLIEDQSGCTEKEVKYIKKQQAKDADARAKQVARLNKMKAGKMKPELRTWLNQRLAILKQL